MATSFSGSPIASRVREHFISIAVTVRGMPRVCGRDLFHGRDPSEQISKAKLVGKVHASRVSFRCVSPMLIRMGNARNVNDQNEKADTKGGSI
jgi:hypothetical protein